MTPRILAARIAKTARIVRSRIASPTTLGITGIRRTRAVFVSGGLQPSSWRTEATSARQIVGSLPQSPPNAKPTPLTATDDQQEVDEESWIWHTEKRHLLRKRSQELIEFCQHHQVANETNNIRKHIQLSQRDPKNRSIRGKLIQAMLHERNILRKRHKEYLKAFKDKKFLQTQQERDFYDATPYEELRSLCRAYQINMKGKKRFQLVRLFLEKQATVSAEEHALLREHASRLPEYCNLLGAKYEKGGKSSSAPLSLLRRLNRLRYLTFRIHDKLVARCQKNGQSLPSTLVLDKEQLSWKDQLFFYHDRHRLRRTCQLLGIDEEKHRGKKTAQTLRKICRVLNIKWEKVPHGTIP